MIIKNINAAGLFGGASLNFVLLTLINTDGIDVHEIRKSTAVPYPESLACDIRAIIGKRLLNYADLEADENVQQLKENMCDFYAETLSQFLGNEAADVVGIDGLTIGYDAENKCSYQLENGQKLSDISGYKIVTHFHKADLLSGGQAAPLSPPLINAIGQKINKPVLFIDIETVCSLIYLGESGEITAFDCAPGRAMIEDWTFKRANMQTDYNGKYAALGKVHTQIVDALLKHKFLRKNPPKSLDIMTFSEKREHLEGLSLEDGTATATAFIAEAVYQAALDFLPKIPHDIYVIGSGLRNPTLMRMLKQNFAPRELKFLQNGEVYGAVSTAFNAARRVYSLPITFPTTTGAYEPMSGGEIYEKK